MSDLSKVNILQGGYGHGLSYDERRKLEEVATTESVLNLAAQRGGVLKKTEHLELHGEDATRREVHDASKLPGHDPLHVAEHMKDGVLHTAFDVAEVFLEHHVEHLLEKAAGVALANVAIVAKEHAEVLIHAWEAGDLEAEARVQDAMHLALTGTLAGLPERYVAAQVAHRKDSMSGSGGETARIATALKNDPQLLGLLQLRCDEGMKCALDSMVSGEGSTRYFERHPGLGARYRQDAAFRKGFDAITWSKDNDPAGARKAVEDLRARDARNSATNIVWQG